MLCGQFLIATSKVLSVPGKVGGQVFVTRSMSSPAGVSGLAAEWRSSAESFKSTVEGVGKSI